MTSPTTALRNVARDKLPKDIVTFLRKRFGPRRPWDPGVVLRPPEPGPGERIGAPDFVGVGTQKSGTTWWYLVIATHPGVHDVKAANKERHFFGRYFDAPFTNDDVLSYHRWFPRPDDRLVGEWTPGYMHQQWVPRLLAEAAPDAKLLVLLRDPIERYRSGLTHYAARGSHLESHLAIEAVARGMYAQQLRWLTHSFPTEQILVLQYEACRNDPLTASRRTFEFLGVDPEQETAGIASEVNATRVEKIVVPDHLRRTLQELYQPEIEDLLTLVPEIDLDLWPNFSQ